MLRAPDGIETAMRGRVQIESLYGDAPREVDDDDFRDMLLAALVAVAGKSKRRQADLVAALRRANIQASQDRVMAALGALEAETFIRDVIPLYDGGILVTVTNTGMDLLGRSAHWRFLQDLQPIQT